MSKRLIAGLIALGIISQIPSLYGFGQHLIAKRHIQNGCKAFMQDSGGKDADNVGIFQTEFSKAALHDIRFLPIAKASDALDASRNQAVLSGFETEWIDALGTVQGLCLSYAQS